MCGVRHSASAVQVANTLFLTKYCSEDLMKNFSVQQRSALIKYFMSELLTEKWPAQVLTETMCYVIIPMLKDAEKKQEIPELLPDELLDDMFETICKQQSNKYIQQHLSCVRPSYCVSACFIATHTAACAGLRVHGSPLLCEVVHALQAVRRVGTCVRAV